MWETARTPCQAEDEIIELSQQHRRSALLISNRSDFYYKYFNGLLLIESMKIEAGWIHLGGGRRNLN